MSVSTWPSEFPRLETERLLLRELGVDDADALFRTYADPEVSRYFMAQPFAGIAQAERLIAAFASEYVQRKAITWAVTRQGADECIGTCSLMMRSPSSAELGYDLARSWWGQGVMTEALTAVLHFAHGELGLERVVADTLSANRRSVRLLERLGFREKDVRAGRHYFVRTRTMMLGDG